MQGQYLAAQNEKKAIQEAKKASSISNPDDVDINDGTNWDDFDFR